ncbi:hypothetical protein BCR34DRAFT_231869 [Clohesyomyces aquaticus]|uniref:Uncharacterized protein n=1 Tax=Clohesyomyces aquaticus TaxID=1231657 RepID=A0A1Y1ZVV9_9PLEO|nr:hypothetical protein BCR34DRAFT_231869 [Clohesyomyces aquaticus]
MIRLLDQSLVGQLERVFWFRNPARRVTLTTGRAGEILCVLSGGSRWIVVSRVERFPLSIILDTVSRLPMNSRFHQTITLHTQSLSFDFEANTTSAPCFMSRHDSGCRNDFSILLDSKTRDLYTVVPGVQLTWSHYLFIQRVQRTILHFIIPLGPSRSQESWTLHVHGK